MAIHSTVEEALHSRFESELVGFPRARSPRAKNEMAFGEKKKGVTGDRTQVGWKCLNSQNQQY